MARRKKEATRSSLIVSLIVHVAVISAIFYFAAKTGIIPEQVARVFNIVPLEKKPEKKPEPPPPPPPTPPKEEAKPAPETPPQNPPPTAPPPPLRAATVDPNALPPRQGAPLFTAEARPQGAAAAPVIQPQTRPGGTVTPSTRNIPAVTANQSLFAAESTKPSTVAAVLEERKSAVTVQDAVSSEQISRSGTGDAAEVVTKITGASVVEGKHAVIRGLSDRYNATTLNGGEVPSADPYRKSVQIDVFSTDVIDRVITTKTFTPDLPGSFTGGGINIVTKSFPARRFLKFNAGTSYNTLASQNDFLTYEGGGRDWTAMDDGSRQLPDSLKAGIAVPQLRSPSRETLDQALARGAAVVRYDALMRELGPAQFAPSTNTAPLNQNYSLSLGDTTRLFGLPFGYFGGLSYEQKYSARVNAVNNRYGPALTPTRLLTEAQGVAETAWGANLNLALQLHPDHEVAFNFLYTQNSEDIARRRIGTDSTGISDDTLRDESFIAWTERHLRTFQLKGRDVFPELHDLQLDWLASTAQTTQHEPDTRFFYFYRVPDGEGGFNSKFDNAFSPNRPTRFFRELFEDNKNAKLDATLPFTFFNAQPASLKSGAYHSGSERDFVERTFSYEDASGSFRTQGDPNLFISPDQFGYITQRVVANNPNGVRTNYTFNRLLVSDIGNNAYQGEQTVQALYGMADIPLASKLRVVAGARYETTDLNLSSPLGGRALTSLDVLPSVSLVWLVQSNMNVRLSYGQTVARPTYREIAPYRAYDPSTDEVVEGNTNLVVSSIANYDLRWEWFPNPGEVLSVGFFYKDLKRPIEKYLFDLNGDRITFVNRDEAKLFGVEIEARKSLEFIDPLLRELSFGLNLALIQSEVPLTQVELDNKRSVDPDFPDHRPLYDQSPMLLNVDLTWDSARTGTTATLLANLTAERIFIASGVGPDIYEQPGPQLDAILSQRLGRRWRLKLSARNLLDPKIQRTYGAQSEFLFSSYSRGRTFGVSLSVEF